MGTWGARVRFVTVQLRRSVLGLQLQLPLLVLPSVVGSGLVIRVQHKWRLSRLSILGIVLVVWGRYLIVGYLDPHPALPAVLLLGLDALFKLRNLN